MGRTTHTKTQIVVAVVWVVVVAIAEARMALGVVPGAAAHNTPPVLTDNPTGPKIGSGSLAAHGENRKKKSTALCAVAVAALPFQ